MWMGDNRVILGKFFDFLRLDAILIPLSFSAYPIVSAPPQVKKMGKFTLFIAAKYGLLRSCLLA
jgi:hypothetical protein